MTEYVQFGNVDAALKRLTRKLRRDGQQVALARMREASPGERRRAKHLHHLKQVAKGKRDF